MEPDQTIQLPLQMSEPRASSLGVGRMPLPRLAEMEVLHYGLDLLEDESIPESEIKKRLSRLRRLQHASVQAKGPSTPTGLSLDPLKAAGLLAEPGRVPTSTIWPVWATFTDFIRRRVQPPAEAERRITEIEALLRSRKTNGWYQPERVPGGFHARSEGNRNLLFWMDLLAIRERAGQNKHGQQLLRDRTIAGLCIGSPLRWRELISLQWNQIQFEQRPEGKLFSAWIQTSRRGKDLLLPVHYATAANLADLHRLFRRSQDREPEGFVIRQLRTPYDQLSTREAQDILAQAAAASDNQGATLTDLKAALADHLISTHGFNELELTTLFGYGEHKHIRKLLRHHKAWRLNRQVDEAMKGQQY